MKKNLDEYHDFHVYVQNDTLLLADAYNSFRNMCLQINRFHSAYFLPAPGLLASQSALACQSDFGNTKVKLDLLTDIDMLLMAEKGIRGGICHVWIGKTNKNYMKDYDKNKESSYLKYWYE